MCLAICYITKQDMNPVLWRQLSIRRTSEVKWSQSCSTVSDSLQFHRLYSPWNSPGQNTGAGSLSRVQGIFPTQGLNPGLPQCRWILYQLSHKGSPRRTRQIHKTNSQKQDNTWVSTKISGMATTLKQSTDLLRSPSNYPWCFS